MRAKGKGGKKMDGMYSKKRGFYNPQEKSLIWRPERPRPQRSQFGYYIYELNKQKNRHEKILIRNK